jgi:hypothetical protein
MSLIKLTDFRFSLQCVLWSWFWDVMLYSSANNMYWYFRRISCHHHPGMRVPPWWQRQKTLPKHQALFTNYATSQPKRPYSFSQSYPIPTPKKNLSNNRYKFAHLPLDGGRLSPWSLLHVAWSSQHNRISQQILLEILRLQMEQILCAESKSLFETPWQWVSKEKWFNFFRVTYSPSVLACM